jgi:hypothetical protein
MIGIYNVTTKKENRIINIITALFGIISFFYSSKKFQNSVMKGKMNVFHGDNEIRRMADDEVRIYKSIILGTNSEKILDKIMISAPLNSFIKKVPGFIGISDTEILQPFTSFIQREVDTIKVTNEQNKNFGMSAIGDAIGLRSNISNTIDTFVENITKITSNRYKPFKKIEKMRYWMISIFLKKCMKKR